MTEFRRIRVTPAAHGFGAVISGADLSTPLDAELLAEIRTAFFAHSVICFTEQNLDAAGLERFSAELGPFGHDPYVKPMDGFAHVIEVVREARETAPIFGSLWHSDWSFQATPPSATVLYGVDIPARGGDTVFADGYRAFAALSPAMQEVLMRLQGVHSAAPSYGPKGLFARDDSSRSMRIVVSADAEKMEIHPLARRHPETGRLALYINHVYTIGIEGMHADESRALLDFLLKHMTQAQFVYRHRWQAGMLVMWDNRCVVHYADGGYEGQRRLMYRTTLAGERPAL